MPVSDLYTRSTDEVLTALAPLLESHATPGPLKEISVEDYGTMLETDEGVALFINRFSKQTPCGILSPPSEFFRNASKPANARVADSTLNFQFCAFIPTMKDSAARRTTINAVRELAIFALSDLEIMDLRSARLKDLATCAIWILDFSIPVDTTLTSYT
jgi:hypothetical protein